MRKPYSRAILPLSALALTGATLLTLSSLGRASEPTAKKGRAAAAPMAVEWKFTGEYFPYNPAAPVFSEGTVFFCTGKRLYAVDAQTGGLKWRYPKDEALTNPIITTPAVKDGTVYLGAGDGLHFLDAATGTPRRQFYQIRNGIVTSPLVVENNLYFGDGSGTLYGFDVKTMKPLEGSWSGAGRIGVQGGDFAGEIVYANNSLYFVTGDQNLRSVGAANGTLRWAQRLNANFRAATPVLSGDSLYLAVGTTLASYRLTGQSRWQISLPADATAAPAVDENGIAYVVTSDRLIYAVDTRGRGVWKRPAMVEHEVLAAPVIAGDLLVVGTTIGGVYAFDRATGVEKWRYQVKPSTTNPEFLPSSTNIASQPILHNDTLMVLTDDGTLTAFRNGAADGLPPVVTRMMPEAGDYLNGRLPFYISARVEDLGSGINLNTLKLKIDDREIPRRPTGPDNFDKPGFTFENDLGLLEYTLLESETGISQGLARGPHTLTVSATDWKGNTVNKSWTFHVDETLRKNSVRPGSNRNNQNNPLGGNNPRGGGGSSGGGGSGRPGGGGGGNGNG